eukprot:442172-Ditylum_brightwellii.AAC.1
MMQVLATGTDEELLSSKFSKYDVDGDGLFSEEEFTDMCKVEFGQRCEVAIKFMLHSEQFRWEVDIRKNSQLDPSHVLGIDYSYTLED